MNEFEKLCQQNQETVYRYLLALCRDEHLAEELTAETCLPIYRRKAVTAFAWKVSRRGQSQSAASLRSHRLCAWRGRISSSSDKRGRNYLPKNHKAKAQKKEIIPQA